MGCASSNNNHASQANDGKKAATKASPTKARAKESPKKPDSRQSSPSPKKKVDFDAEPKRVGFADAVSVIDHNDAVVSDPGTLQVVRDTRGLAANVVNENFDKDIRKFYHIDWNSELGSGLNGIVRICRHQKTGIAYAMKTLVKKGIPPKKYTQLKDEIKIMQTIDHPHILRIHEYFETRDHIYLITEICSGGELYGRLMRQSGSMYSEQVACQYISNMVGAIAFLHAHNIVHRDLKLENFLFENETDSSHLKLIDFGLSKRLTEDESTIVGAVGSSYYVAPEVLMGRHYDAKCDMWSLGVISYMLLSGIPPFDGKCDREIFQRIRAGRWSFSPQFDQISRQAKDFISRCLVVNPIERISAKDAGKHPWFKLLKMKQTTKNVREDVVSRIQGFGGRNKMTRLCMEVIAYSLSAAQIEDLRKQFLKMDTSHAGEISLDDLRQVMGSMVPEEQIGRIFEGINYSQSGNINYHEFLAATISRRDLKEENMKLAFEMISNHNDYFTGEDISALLGSQKSEDEVDEILESARLNREQKIHFQTFKNLLSLDGESPRYNAGRRGFHNGSYRGNADSKDVHLEIDVDSARSSVDSRDLAGSSGKVPSGSGYAQKPNGGIKSEVTAATTSSSPGPSTEPSPAPIEQTANSADDQDSFWDLSAITAPLAAMMPSFS